MLNLSRGGGMVDAQVSKTCDFNNHEGSIPSLGTRSIDISGLTRAKLRERFEGQDHPAGEKWSGETNGESD